MDTKHIDSASELQKWLSDKTFYSKGILENEKELDRLGEQKALQLFKETANRVPAYKDFLKRNKIKPSLVKTFTDFKKLPYTSKENYIKEYSFEQRCWDGKLLGYHTIASSSGSTGEPLFWPRHPKHDIDDATIRELIYDKIFQINKSRTLLSNSLSLGNWIAGMITNSTANLLIYKNYKFTYMNPGLSEEETIKVIKNISPYFEQTIMIGHPPTLKMFVENNKRKINWQKLNIKFIGTGEGFSENWRDYILDLVGQTNPYTSFINLFGSADAGLLGFETPVSILIRRLCFASQGLNKKIFSESRTPYVYQYDPRLKYIEDINDEITITADTGTPLVRYNIKDHGKVVKYTELLKTFIYDDLDFGKEINSKKLDHYNWQLPFVYLFGRKGFIATIYGLNVYPENIKTVLEHRDMQPYFSGRFKLTTEYTEKHDQYLLLRAELKPSMKSSKELEKKLKKHAIKILKQVNSEYNKLEDSHGQKAHPEIKLYHYGHPKYFPLDKVKKNS
jgi:phenylacetate-CoA ligase